MKETVLTDRSLRIYEGFDLDVSCKVCGREFEVGDKIIKINRRHARAKSKNLFYCPEHFYTERITRDRAPLKAIYTIIQGLLERNI
jgi:hypothetical protein